MHAIEDFPQQSGYLTNIKILERSAVVTVSCLSVYYITLTTCFKRYLRSCHCGWANKKEEIQAKQCLTAMMYGKHRHKALTDLNKFEQVFQATLKPSRRWWITVADALI